MRYNDPVPYNADLEYNQIGFIVANVVKINGTTVTGDGSVGSPWRAATIPSPLPTVDVNIQQFNTADVIGSGQITDKWRGVGVPT